jgi:mono/diheme cytochrome c family protein
MDKVSSALDSLFSHWRWPAATFVVGIGVGMGLIGLVGLATVEFGLFDTTSTKPHAPIIAWATHETFIHSTRLRAKNVEAPPAFTAAEVLAGGQEYVADCEMCHGGPGVHRARWVRGMTPTPPFLLDVAERFTPSQLYWIIARGVKMTSMPAWIETRSKGQIWDVVAFVSTLPKLTPAEYAKIKASKPANSD